MGYFLCLLNVGLEFLVILVEIRLIDGFHHTEGGLFREDDLLFD